MANIFLILFVACVINSMCSAQRTAVGRLLNTEVRKLKRKTDSLQTEVDNIWNEVDGIWAEVSGPGRIAQNYNNRTGTDGLGNINSQNFKTNKHETVNIAQDLKVEVENLVLTARDGLKAEKQWQRETVRNLTEMFDDFKTDMTEESIVVNDQLERLDNESASTHKYCENIRREMETNNTETNERMRELRKELEAQTVINEQMNSKNHALSQTIQEIQNDNENIKTENKALSQTIQEMQNDNENIKTQMQNDNENIKTENKALSQAIQEMQTKLVKLEDTFSSAIATKATLHHVHSCIDGWQIFHGHCYLLMNWGYTWDDASAYCELLNSFLVEIRTDEEREFLFELIGDTTIGYWTGATDRAAERRFVYQRSQQLVPVKYWYPGQPDNWGGDQHCVAMGTRYGNGLEFFDEQCNTKRYCICVRP